jgi:hypothetical protein
MMTTNPSEDALERYARIQRGPMRYRNIPSLQVSADEISGSSNTQLGHYTEAGSLSSQDLDYSMEEHIRNIMPEYKYKDLVTEHNLEPGMIIETNAGSEYNEKETFIGEIIYISPEAFYVGNDNPRRNGSAPHSIVKNPYKYSWQINRDEKVMIKVIDDKNVFPGNSRNLDKKYEKNKARPYSAWAGF